MTGERKVKANIPAATGWVVSRTHHANGRSVQVYYVVAIIDSVAALGAVGKHVGADAGPLILTGPANAAQLATRDMKTGDIWQLGLQRRVAKPATARS